MLTTPLHQGYGAISYRVSIVVVPHTQTRADQFLRYHGNVLQAYTDDTKAKGPRRVHENLLTRLKDNTAENEKEEEKDKLKKKKEKKRKRKKKRPFATRGETPPLKTPRTFFSY
jgi:hypothetical protein